MKTKSLIIFALGLFLFSGACRKNTVLPVPNAPQPKQPAPPPEPTIPVPETWPELPLPPSKLPAPPEALIDKNFLDAEANFTSGKYAEAIPLYDRHIQKDLTTQYKDLAMFRLGISYALACSAPECRARAVAQLKRLVTLFPKSPYSSEARVILGMQSDIEKMRADAKAQEENIKRLNDELERLTKTALEHKPAPIKK
jgi:hypothetical protein